MNYLTTTFRDFVKNQLIAESKKDKQNGKQEQVKENKSNTDWIKQLQDEFNQIIKDYDNL